MRSHQTLTRNRETDTFYTATKCQQAFISQSLPSTKAIIAVTPCEYVPSVVRMPYSPPNTTSSQETTAEPILLLEGDNYRFSENGIARSLYQLVYASTTSRDNNVSSSYSGLTTSSVAIEEIYDLGRARKAFVVREKVNERNKNDARNINTTQQQVIHLDSSSKQMSVLLKEIADESIDPTGAEKGAGTGSRTWDSSIAMSMYFSSHPDLMVGNVIELGSGVGLGGILSFLFRSLSPLTVPFHSMTLTDYKHQVLNYCKENVTKFCESSPASSSIHVAKLDWYDFLREKNRILGPCRKIRYGDCL